MGRPGTGACERIGTPGRGETGGAPMTGGLGWPSFATRSGRGGTTGRADGWPARPGRAGGRPAGPGAVIDVGGLAPAGCGRGGAGRCGAMFGRGRLGPGLGARTPSLAP